MLSLYQRPALPGWVTLVPAGETARAALVEQPSGRRPVVHWVSEEDWIQPAATLRRLRASRHLARHRCVALLARGQYQLVPLDAPDELPREEWRQALRWQAMDLLSFPVEEAAFDLLEVPQPGAAGARPRVLAVAAPQAQVDRVADAARAARTPLAAVDIPETALRNIGALVEPADRAQALLWVGSGSVLVITVGGELVQARSLDLSAAQLAAPAEDAARQQALDRAGLELQRTLDSFERQNSRIAMSRLLVVPTPGSAQLCRFLGDLLYPPVEELDLGDALDLSAVPELGDPARLGPWVLAIGAALREG